MGTDEIIDGALTGLAGLADGLLLQTTPPLRTWLYGIDPVDTCSAAYHAGQDAAIAAGVARLVYAGAASFARTMSRNVVAAGDDVLVEAVSAVEVRQTFKLAFRLGTFPNTGLVDAGRFAVARGAGAIESAGKTNLKANVYGGVAAGTGIDAYRDCR